VHQRPNYPQPDNIRLPQKGLAETKETDLGKTALVGNSTHQRFPQARFLRTY
jgi:hypothetical protein